MKNYIKNWKTIFILAILLLFVILFCHILNDKMTPPSKQWSKEIKVDELSNSSVNESTRVRSTTIPIPEENRFIILWNEKDYVKYVIVNKDGERGKVNKIKISLDEPIDIKGVFRKGIIEIYTIEGGYLKEYNLDYKKCTFNFKKIIRSKVKDFLLNKESIILGGEDYIGIINEEGKFLKISDYGTETMDILSDNLGNLKIAYIGSIKKSTKELYVMYAGYNSKNKTFNNSKVAELIDYGYGMSFTNIVIGEDKKNTYILVPKQNFIMANPYIVGEATVCRRNPLKIETSISLYSFGKNQLNKIKVSYLKGFDVDNLYLVHTNDDEIGMNLLASTSEIQGNKTDVVNIRRYVVKNGTIEAKEFLTNTQDISINPVWFKIGVDKYLQWENITGDSTKIMFASTNSNVIKGTSKVKKTLLVDSLLEALMASGFALAYMLLLFTCIILPTLILILLTSMFFMNWVEANSKIATYISIAVHITAEMIFTVYLKIKKPMVIKLAPSFMQNPFGLYGMIILIGIVALYCMKAKYKNEKLDKIFVNQYAFFAVIDIILYALLFFPYYYL